MSNLELVHFRGDLSWLHAREGHVGRPYWPGGQSGVTLDPGVDVGHADPNLVVSAYKGLLTVAQLASLSVLHGITGREAEGHLKDAVLKDIRISFSEAVALMPVVALKYWDHIGSRFPVLRERGTPPEVQTALLSLAFNRGAGNPALSILRLGLQNRDWDGVGRAIGTMQQDHELRGVRVRRRLESQLILGRNREVQA